MKAIDEIAMTYWCPTCEAEPSYACRTRNGRLAIKPHADRLGMVKPGTAQIPNTEADLLAMTDEQIRTRAAEIAEEIDGLASQRAPHTETQRLWLLAIFERVNELANMDRRFGRDRDDERRQW